jgi:thiol-disulfide isomerase/thioredoxin
MSTMKKHTSSTNLIWIIAFMAAWSLAGSAWAGGWSLKDKNGTHFTLSDMKGKWVLVNFWAPWCPPCLREIPNLVALQKTHKELQVIGVAVMYKSRKEVMDVISKKSISYPIVFGNEDTAGDFGGLVGTPTSFLYSPSGELIELINGTIMPGDIERRMQ